MAFLALSAGVPAGLYAAEAAPPPAVVQLSLNENPYGPSPLAAKAITAAMENIRRYPDKDGVDFIAAVAAHEGVEPEQIITGEILELLGVYLGLKGGPGGEFIYTVPGYPALVNAAARVGGVVVSVPLNAKLENDLPALEAAVNAKTQALFLVNPHNPSGTVSETQAFHAFVSKVSRQALVIVDEAYLEFTDDFAGRTAVAHVRAGENVLVFRTFAKAYGLAGLSLGYAVASKPVAEYLRKQGLGGLHELNRLSVAAASASLADKDYIGRVHTAIAGERAKWHAVLDELGLKHTESQANFVYFDSGRPSAEVATKLKEKGIIVGRAFPPYNTWVRITIGTPGENEKTQTVLREIVR